METINNMANAATKAIWGPNEAKEEPVSGVVGNTSTGEPYDAGNIEDPQKKASVAEAHSEPTASNPAPVTSTTTTSAPATSTSDTTNDVASGASTTAFAAAESATKDPVKHKEDIGKPELKHQSPQDAAPHDSAAGKTDTRHPADPATDPKPINQDVSTESGTSPTNKGDKLDGPGPRPLEVVAKERGGDAGNGIKGSGGGLVGGDASGPSDTKNEQEEDGPQKQSYGEGTGEKYVKSTGLAADGGDFDATKPGAGREADRLLEEKDPAAAAARAAALKSSGNPSDGSKSDDQVAHSSSHNSNEKEKKSLGDKIKAKLHRH